MFPQLCPAHFREAARLHGMHSVIYEHSPRWPIREFTAAYVGHGMGLCQDYFNADSCEKEEEQMIDANTLAISFTNQALAIDLQKMGKAEGESSSYFNSYATDWTLGHATKPSDAEVLEDYWKNVREAIRKLVLGKTPVEKILLFGERVSQDLYSQVKQVISPLQDELPQYYRTDAGYIAAEGAAKLAKRALDLAILQKDAP